jgi:cell division protein FtsW
LRFAPLRNDMKFLASPRSGSPDYLFIAVVLVLTIFGLVMLTSASSDLAKREFGDASYYLIHQVLYGLLPGIVGFLLAAFLYYRNLEKAATVLFIAAIILLVLVFVPGVGVTKGGSSRWIDIGPLTFQPSEFLKFAFFVYLATWIARNQSRGRSLTEGFIPFLFLVGGSMLLLLFQPATTVAVLIFAASLLMYFTGGARFSFLVAAVLIGCLSVALVIRATPYRWQRITSFLHQTEDVIDAGYQVDWAKQAIGAGTLWGVGYGKSTTKLSYLPEPIGDSIFAVIAEELGFVGSMIVILAFFVFILRGLRIARGAPDAFGRLIATGFTSLIGLQAFTNIGAISGLIPLTGVPLPFISYGGTALAVFLTMSGVIVNISRYRK